MQQNEKRREKLARLLLENKVRLARQKVIDVYRQELGYELNPSQFLSLELSDNLKKETYMKVSQLQSQAFVRFQDVLAALEKLKVQYISLSQCNNVLYYLDTYYSAKLEKVNVGGIMLQLQDFWYILSQINEPKSDIVVVDNKLSFCICVEQEESSYLLTYW